MELEDFTSSEDESSHEADSDRAMSEKVLVVIADEQVRVYHTAGVETAVVVDGEDVHLPDDWTELPKLVLHSLPITVRGDEMFCEPEDDSGVTPEGSTMRYSHLNAFDAVRDGVTDEMLGPFETIEVHDLRRASADPLRLKAPYCSDCDTNHPLNIGCDGLVKTYGCCGAAYGQKHKDVCQRSHDCADQNPR